MKIKLQFLKLKTILTALCRKKLVYNNLLHMVDFFSTGVMYGLSSQLGRESGEFLCCSIQNSTCHRQE